MESAPESVHLCGRPERSPEEKAARDARRALGYTTSVRLLQAAEEAALAGETDKAHALRELAMAWDSVSY